MKLTTLLLSAAALTATSSYGAIIMLDFGPTTVTGGDLTNSPGHVAGAVAGTDTTWNKLETADVASGLLYADGTAATGVSVNLGTELGNGIANITSTIEFGTNPASTNALGDGTNGTNNGWFKSGIFAAPSVGTDGIFGTFGVANGLRVDGLAAGNYDIYFVGFNTNENNAGATMNLYSAVGASSDSFDFSSLTANTSAITNNTAWTLGENYAKASVSLTAGQSLFLANDTTGLTNNRGFINSVQIVSVAAVPEPSTYALFAGFGVLGLVLLRRRSLSR
jgi:hypothetical protein